MEPGQTSEAKRSRGFLGRNWFLLLWLFALLPLSSLFLVLYVPPRIEVLCVHGDLTFGVSRFALKSLFEAGWKTPRLGSGARFYEDPMGYWLTIPIWLPLALLLFWITFREWRRKRAAKGNACL
jgi:hypothetical protein